MKKILSFGIVIILCLMMTLSVHAAPVMPYLVDGAGLISEEEEQKLLEQLSDVSERQDMDIVIITVRELDGKKAMAYADDA